MKINEFRSLISIAPFDDIIKIASELYKAIPKSIKEDPIDGLDLKIRSIIEHKEPIKQIQEISNYASLHEEIETFIDNVYNYYYIKPNRVINKSQRSKWRFLVMRFIKEIQKISPDDEDFSNSNDDLINIFNTLAYGCAYIVFTTDNPFDSICKPQYDFYKLICSRVFDKKFNLNRILDMIEAACNT
ncbi:MAG: hypothetical protein IJS50_02705, partial [Desulfovibrio sp.]|nr:hypothetical protein [Desulfovibrio sp.]